jgi:tetratricopeptide (TPR) repeat protein
MSEDVNIEHLLDVFTSIDTKLAKCLGRLCLFMNHLYWHKPRLVMLGPKVEALPDDHPSKPQCLLGFALLFSSVGNWVEYKRLLTHTIKLWRERGDDHQVVWRLGDLSQANREMGLYKEGIQLTREALEICERLGDTAKQADSLISLAYALYDDGQLDAAEEAASRATDLLPEEGEQFQLCQGHRILGNIYKSKGDTEKAVYHFEVALEIASSLNMVDQLFWIHYALANLVFGQGRFDDAHAHIEHAKSHAINNAYHLGRAMELQADFWYRQRMLEKAKFEASRAADVYEKLGAAQDLGNCRELLRWIDEEMNSSVVSDESDVDGELLETLPLPACIKVSIQGQEAK